VGSRIREVATSEKDRMTIAFEEIKARLLANPKESAGQPEGQG
jgi:hypothetical protein